MAKVKNSFLKSKMNKDLDNRLIPNGEYRNALNITVNNSDGEDVGTAQTVRGNLEVIDFQTITGVAGLQVVGLFEDEFADIVFAFVTNNTISTYNTASYSAIVSWQVNSNNTKIIVEGNWLNFSTLNPIVVSLLEELLFFTDNRNQPRKVNINQQPGYYTTEDQISVAKYYPYETIQLFNPSEVPATVIATALTTIASTSFVLTLDDATGVVIGQGVLGIGILLNSFVVGINGLEITLNQNANVALGTTIEFVSVETSMKDAISKYLPTQADGVVINVATLTEFTLNPYEGYLFEPSGNTPDALGANVWTIVGTEYVNTGAVIIDVTKDLNFGGLQFTTDIDLALSVSDKILLAIPNPYYDSDFAEIANVDYLEDKFVRFSYRFLFDDGEYSLIAPFTQPCFIPKQDGYFLKPVAIGTDLDVVISDQQKAFQSTEVAFMENKVNQIMLNVPLPFSAGSMLGSLKVKEIEILYKESNQIAIKVVDSIVVSGNFSGNDNYFQYEYGSKSPYKSIPEKENVRVYDKVPVKAQSQEIISNRVVYANYQDKHTPPNFLDYNVAATPKASFGVGPEGYGTSKIEYPNATLKQNRNYEVGVVLSDRFGRQSTVILSESELNQMPSYLASTIYSQFSDESDQATSTGFDGDSLKIQFNNLIPASYIGSPLLYNGNQNSAAYNPLGWYSYKIVVKQQQQEYYNAYIAPIMKGYPGDASKEPFETSHISLFGDNINKIPRDLNELGPTQVQFRSSVKLWPRVAGDSSLVGGATFRNSIQFFPKRIGDIASSIATIDDLFDLPNDPGENIGNLTALDIKATTTNTVRFQLSNPSDPVEVALCLGMKNGDEIRGVNYGTKDTIITEIISDQTTPPAAGSIWEVTLSDAPQGTIGGNNIGFYRSGGRNYFYNQESDPLVARISTTKQAGVVIPNPYSSDVAALNIYEVEAQESLLDIFWETSTSGLISTLNEAIASGPGSLIYTTVEGWNPQLSEQTNEGEFNNGVFVNSFRATLSNGQSINPPAGASATLLSVYEQGNTSATNNQLGNPYIDYFQINAIGDGASFEIQVLDQSQLVNTSRVFPETDDLTFEILFDHTDPETTSLTALLDVELNTIFPTIEECPGDITKTDKSTTIFIFTGVNGSFTTLLNQKDLVWSLGPETNEFLFSIGNVVSSNPFLNNFGKLVTTSGPSGTPAGTYPIEVILTDGSGLQDTCNFNVIFDYATSVDFDGGVQSAVLTNAEGGGNQNLTVTGGFTIANAPVGNVDFQIRGNTTGSGTDSFFAGYQLNIVGPLPATTTYTLNTATQGAPAQTNISAATPLGNGDYTFTIEVNVDSDFPSTPIPTTAIGTIIATF